RSRREGRRERRGRGRGLLDGLCDGGRVHVVPPGWRRFGRSRRRRWGGGSGGRRWRVRRWPFRSCGELCDLLGELVELTACRADLVEARRCGGLDLLEVLDRPGTFGLELGHLLGQARSLGLERQTAGALLGERRFESQGVAFELGV